MKKVVLIPLLTLLAFSLGCPADKNARDTAAALSGLLVTAQTQNMDSCVPNPSQSICQMINKGVAAQNALITATETYCGWAVTSVPPPPNTECTPPKDSAGASQVLKAAIANANQMVTELKGVIH